MSPNGDIKKIFYRNPPYCLENTKLLSHQFEKPTLKTEQVRGKSEKLKIRKNTRKYSNS